MVRLACVSVPALPLQLALRAEPELGAHPVAVVESERAQALLLWVNARARSAGVRPGQRHAAALSLAGDLRARVVAPEAVRETVERLLATLQRFTPHVEPAPDEPGLFWLSALGLRRLYRGPKAWAEAIHRTLGGQGWQSAVVVGRGHFTCAAVARGGEWGGDKRRGSPRVRVFRDAGAERRAAGRVPLTRLGLPPRTLEALEQLGLARLGDLLRLPADGLLQRFGTALYRLHRLATGALGTPLQPRAERLPVVGLLAVEPPEADAARLLFCIKGRLPFLLAELAARQEALHALRVGLLLDDHTRQVFTVRPAQPTREERLIVELVRLRLEALRLPAWVSEIELVAEGRPRTLEQPSLLEQVRRRDLAAANRALAQLRAEYGEGAVVHAVPREGHLPEARFAWAPLQRLDWPHGAAAEPSGAGLPGAGLPGSGQSGSVQPAAAEPGLVRRLLEVPQPLPGWPRDPARWKYDRSPDADGLVALHGPYAVSGGWWAREQRRDYYLAETYRGQVLWVYHDRERGRWFCQGWVE